MLISLDGDWPVHVLMSLNENCHVLISLDEGWPVHVLISLDKVCHVLVSSQIIHFFRDFSNSNFDGILIPGQVSLPIKNFLFYFYFYLFFYLFLFFLIFCWCSTTLCTMNGSTERITRSVHCSWLTIFVFLRCSNTC